MYSTRKTCGPSRVSRVREGSSNRFGFDAMFSTTGWQYALHAPPIEHKLVLRSITGLERIGASLWPGIGGAIMVEGKKELLAPTGRARVAPALGRLVTVPAPRNARDAPDER